MPTQDSADLSQILRAVQALAPHIEAATDTMESERRLPEVLAQALMQAGVFRMGVPQAYGGGQLDPLAQVRVWRNCRVLTVQSAGCR